MTVIEVHDLGKRYKNQIAVDGVSFTVERGEIFGILGRNGAGKTTAVECVAGLRRPDSGSVRVLGIDPNRNRRRLHERVGVQLQHAQLPPSLRVWEALDLFASFHRRARDWRELLDQWGLAEHRAKPFGQLSGGQQQRLFIALALVGNPEVVFLDELTAGLDPGARRATWEVIEQVRSTGVTVVLVSHLMEEAQRLCDRLAVFDRGRIVAVDTPVGLIDRVGSANTLDDAFVALTGHNFDT